MRSSTSVGEIVSDSRRPSKVESSSSVMVDDSESGDMMELCVIVTEKCR